MQPEKEIFIKVDNFSRYYVSNFGNVKSETPHGKGKILTPMIDGCGYNKVRLYNDEGYKDFFVHRLVAKYFMGGLEDEINHIDGNKDNNSVDNLEYSSRYKNINHSYHDIENGHQCKFDKKEIREIRKRAVNENQRELSEEFGCDKSLISRIKNKKRYGYVSDL